MRRRNSGDEEIRKLLRDLNENPTSAIAERLAAALRRREELDPRPEVLVSELLQDANRAGWRMRIEALAEVVASRLLDDEDIKLDDGEIYNRVMKWLSKQNAISLWADIGEVVDHMEASFRREELGATEDSDEPEAVYAYTYTNENGTPLAACPGCGGDLTVSGGINLVVSVGGRVLDLESRLDSFGRLEDVDDQVATGHHSGTCCGHCGELLINLENVIESESGGNDEHAADEEGV